MVTPATTEIPEAREVTEVAPVVVEEAPVVADATNDPDRPKRRQK
jgi:hypothetical protein